MRKVIGIGETILDIIFRDGQPYNAIPGGSIFNTLVSLSRVGVQTSFIGELGDDRVGRIIRHFMQQNGMSTDYMDCFSEGLSSVSLAFLDEGKDADYMCYSNRSKRRSNISMPDIRPDDIVLFGSYYALNADTRERVMDIVQYARAQRAIVYYDPNFRKAHAHEAIQLRATVMDNYEAADLVRGSDEDFVNLYKKTDPDEVYRDEVQFYCKRLIATRGAAGISLYTEKIRTHYDVPPHTALSPIGAGAAFNAGLIYSLIKYRIGQMDLPELSPMMWDKMIALGIDFAAEVCGSLANYVSPEFAAKHREE
jgi:hypothetical protein